MTSPIRNRRAEAVKLADALNSIEGVPVSDYAIPADHGQLAAEHLGEVAATGLRYAARAAL